MLNKLLIFAFLIIWQKTASGVHSPYLFAVRENKIMVVPNLFGYENKVDLKLLTDWIVVVSILFVNVKTSTMKVKLWQIIKHIQNGK